MPADTLWPGLPYGAATRNPFNYVKVDQIARDSTTAWLTLAEITDHINLFDDTSQDDYLTGLEVAVRQAIEDYLGLSIFPVTYRVWYGLESINAAPACLDLPEVSQNTNSAISGVTINSLKYWTGGTTPVLTTVDPSIYYYDASGNKLVVSTLPNEINTAMTAPIVLEYATVSNPLASYKVIKWAGLLLLTHLYNNRSNATDKAQVDIPFGVSTLLRPYKPLVM